MLNASDGTPAGTGLWRSDGTGTGTTLVRAFGPSYTGDASVADLPGMRLFAAYDDPTGTELWRTDGTTAGTALVRDIVSGNGSSDLRYLTAVGTTAFFGVRLGFVGDPRLWKSDGTAAGTVQVVSTPNDVSDLIEFGGTLFFAGYDTTRGGELWKSNGTAGC